MSLIAAVGILLSCLPNRLMLSCHPPTQRLACLSSLDTYRYGVGRPGAQSAKHLHGRFGPVAGREESEVNHLRRPDAEG
jgi:hypothetical protein